tara:strand:+ start:223 stop:825 length:603 start_codon:yes stop_codon:yes gene_type:complete
MKYVLRTFKQTSPGDADLVVDGLKELRSMFGWSGIGFLTKSWSNPMGLVSMARTFDSTEEIHDHFDNISDQMREKIQKINEICKSSWSLMLSQHKPFTNWDPKTIRDYRVLDQWLIKPKFGNLHKLIDPLINHSESFAGMKPAVSISHSGTGSIFVSRLLKKASEIILDEKTREAQIDFVSKYGDLINEVNRNQTPLIFD